MTPENKRYLGIGSQLQNAVESQLFGKPCFKIYKKAFICFFENEMVFKLTGKAHSEALSLDGSILFDPSGKKRPMKEWVQIPNDYIDQWEKFAKEAHDYVNPIN